jgi:hypothetical protein
MLGNLTSLVLQVKVERRVRCLNQENNKGMTSLSGRQRRVVVAKERKSKEHQGLVCVPYKGIS